MGVMRYAKIVLLHTCLWAACVCSSIDPGDEAKIDQFVEEFMECLSIPGVSLAAVRDGQVALAKGYGKADIDNDIDVTANTRFRTASLSKAFTAVLVAHVLEEFEEYDWDTPVSEMVGDKLFFSDGFRTNSTTMRDLLAHKMGVARHDSLHIMDQWSNEELVERIRFFEPIKPYRTSYLYNNLMYGVAGYVIQQLSGGISYEELVTQRIFEVLGMDNSTFITTTDHTNYALPYTGPRDGPKSVVPWEYYDGLRLAPGGGAIDSTANDMAKWLNFMLGNFEVDPKATTSNGAKSLDPEIARQTFHNEVVTLMPDLRKPIVQETVAPLGIYARGWLDGHYRGYRLINHDGNSEGYYTELALMPDVNIGIYSAFNYADRNGLERGMMHVYIADVLMGLDTWFNASDICNLPLPPVFSADKHQPWPLQSLPITAKHEATSFPRLPLEAYVGVYGNFGYGNISVFIHEDDETLLEMQYGNHGHFDLLPVNGTDSFTAIGNRSPADLIHIGDIHFSSSMGDDVIDTLTTPGFEPMDPPDFVRGLDYADAPPPSLEGCAP